MTAARQGSCRYYSANADLCDRRTSRDTTCVTLVLGMGEAVCYTSSVVVATVRSSCGDPLLDQYLKVPLFLPAVKSTPKLNVSGMEPTTRVFDNKPLQKE